MRSFKNNVTKKLFAYNLYIYIYIYVCVCVCVCVCVYLSRIFLLMHISLNNMDMFCLHIFVYVI